MLTAIRDRASGWIAWFIVGLLCIPFAFWGISEYFQGEAIVDIADINGVEIDYYEYQNILAERRRQMSAADRDADCPTPAKASRSLKTCSAAASARFRWSRDCTTAVLRWTVRCAAWPRWSCRSGRRSTSW